MLGGVLDVPVRGTFQFGSLLTDDGPGRAGCVASSHNTLPIGRNASNTLSPAIAVGSTDRKPNPMFQIGELGGSVAAHAPGGSGERMRPKRPLRRNSGVECRAVIEWRFYGGMVKR